MRILSLPLMLALGVPAAAGAQMMVQPLPGSSAADLLAATMRRVAANPLDVDALLTAGEQSLRVDDLSGAASLFARAEKIDPRNGRVRAGMAAILVRSERPGEALRYFAQAEAAGLDPRRFAADRGFAYDLVGDQPRAQADYRTALAGGNTSDETIRRYALSLGISGRGEEALRQLEPLLGRSDRAAWRARAFILAMTGDRSGAERIAATMMPPGMADGLRPFFERLPALPAADRAFAVHFGEVRATPERVADARLAPVLAPLAPEQRPVQVAALATTPTVPAESRRDRRRREREARRAPVGRVALASAPIVLPPAAAVVTPPVQVASLDRTARSRVQPARPMAGAGSASAAPTPGFSAAPSFANGASRPGSPAAAPTGTPAAAPSFVAMGSVEPGPSSAIIASTPIVEPIQSGLAPLVAAPAAGLAAVPATPLGTSASLPSTDTTGATTIVPVAPARPSALASVDPGVALAAVGTGSSTVSPSPAARRPARVAARTRAPDSVLARIVASLSIPAAELGVTGRERVAPSGSAMDGATRTAEALRTKAARDAEAEAVARRLARGRTPGARKLAAVEASPTDAADAPEDARKTAAKGRKPAADPDKPADRRKALADRKAAAEKKAAADKAVVERRAARANPSRIWVQVAGGAYEGDLPKAWAATRAKAPDAFAGRTGYAAKLRATNRVVTGPFKTDAEARAFVNRLARSGVSAFPFTSDAGETVARLPSK